jgi:arylsulfatase A-like enzyme
MTPSEHAWWAAHAQTIVNTMASSNGPDVVGLLHDRTSYGVIGDHGGASKESQRVPMVFWSPGLAFHNDTASTFHTTDVLPTILRTMGIPLTHPVDGQARPLH